MDLCLLSFSFYVVVYLKYRMPYSVHSNETAMKNDNELENTDAIKNEEKNTTVRRQKKMKGL